MSAMNFLTIGSTEVNIDRKVKRISRNDASRIICFYYFEENDDCLKFKFIDNEKYSKICEEMEKLNFLQKLNFIKINNEYINLQNIKYIEKIKSNLAITFYYHKMQNNQEPPYYIAFETKESYEQAEKTLLNYFSQKLH